MWDLPGLGFKPVSPALAGGFLTTVPPGKPMWGVLTGVGDLAPGLQTDPCELDYPSSEITVCLEKLTPVALTNWHCMCWDG